MIVTEQQRKNLYSYLDNIFKYRETLIELYDHILTAVERYDGELPYQEAVTQIIQYDFGGSQRLIDLEKNYKKTATDELENLLWKTFVKNMKVHGLALAIITLCTQFYFKINLLATPEILISVSVFFLLTFAQYFYLPFRAGYQGNTSKKQVLKEEILTNLLNFPNRIFGILFGAFATQLHIIQSSPYLGAIIILVFYVTLPVFLLSYYQSFKKEYSLKPINS